MILLIALIFAAILILPILFSLKCDGTLGDNAPWTAIWTPMWVVDAFLLIFAMYFMFYKPEPPTHVEDGDIPPPEEEKIPEFIIKPTIHAKIVDGAYACEGADCLLGNF